MSDSSKTEKATPQRRKKAREQGQVARSRELGGLLALMVSVLTLSYLSREAPADWSRLYKGLLLQAATGDLSVNGPQLYWTTVEVLRWITPVLLCALLVSVAASYAQGGLNIAPAALTPKIERFDPAANFGQIFSLSSFGGLFKSLVPFLVLGALGVQAIRERWGELVRASGLGIADAVSLVAGIIQAFAWKACLVLLLFAGVDYLLTWRQAESKLKMSHEEIKREHKENEGNPFIKGQIRRRQRAMRQRRPLEAVSTATMVVTNPTHFAVALRYEPPMVAPEVVAKGLDLMALKIRSIAEQNNVPVMENKPLAQALYKNVEVGEAIPSDLYQAVAEILVVVFRAQAELREKEAMRSRRSATGEVMGEQ